MTIVLHRWATEALKVMVECHVVSIEDSESELEYILQDHTIFHPSPCWLASLALSVRYEWWRARVQWMQVYVLWYLGLLIGFGNTELRRSIDDCLDLAQTSLSHWETFVLFAFPMDEYEDGVISSTDEAADGSGGSSSDGDGARRKRIEPEWTRM